MKFSLGIVLLLSLFVGSKSQELDLGDALLDDDPTPAPPKPPVKPPSGGDFELDLSDAFGDGPTKAPPKKPAGGGGGDGELDLSDAFDFGPTKKPAAGDPNPKPNDPGAKPPNSGGGGGNFGDNDLFDLDDGGNYKPDGGRSGGGRAQDPGYDPHGGAGDAGDTQDVDLPWALFLKMLNNNMPEEFHIWISNLKQVVIPLLERALELLNVVA